MQCSAITPRLSTSLLYVGVIGWLAMGASARAADDEFAYHTVLSDTLIGIGRRLLVEPRRWREVQQRNHIGNANRMQRGAILHIPYTWLRLTTETAIVTDVVGPVTTSKAGIAVGDLLSPGAIIETGSDGSLTLQMADGSSVTLQKASTLKLQEMARVTGVQAAHSIQLKLDAGRLETQVKPHRDVGRFEIITPIAVAAVRGTRFRDSFEAEGAHGTTETLQGTVGVSGNGDAVAVSAGFGTRVAKSQPPLLPVPLLAPPAFSELATMHTTTDLELNWPAIAGAGAYRIQLATDAEFHAIVTDIKLAALRAEIPQVADGEYWLRIRSIDQFEIEGTDAVAHFTQHILPKAPQVAASSNPSSATGRATRLAWNSEPNVAAYRFQLSADASFVDPVVNRSDVHEHSTEIAEVAPGDYVWRVAAANAEGEWGPWSSLQSFTQLPDPPVPTVPELGRKQITITWTGQSAQRYHLEMSRHRSFKHLLIDKGVDGTQLTIPKPLPGSYYIRVCVIAADGSSGPYGEPRRFVVPVPQWVEILVPSAIILALLI